MCGCCWLYRVADVHGAVMTWQLVGSRQRRCDGPCPVPSPILHFEGMARLGSDIVWEERVANLVVLLWVVLTFTACCPGSPHQVERTALILLLHCTVLGSAAVQRCSGAQCSAQAPSDIGNAERRRQDRSFSSCGHQEWPFCQRFQSLAVDLRWSIVVWFCRLHLALVCGAFVLQGVRQLSGDMPGDCHWPIKSCCI